VLDLGKDADHQAMVHDGMTLIASRDPSHPAEAPLDQRQESMELPIFAKRPAPRGDRTPSDHQSVPQPKRVAVPANGAARVGPTSPPTTRGPIESFLAGILKV